VTVKLTAGLPFRFSQEFRRRVYVRESTKQRYHRLKSLPDGAATVRRLHLHGLRGWSDEQRAPRTFRNPVTLDFCSMINADMKT
jgi:hypothetical protein